MGLLLLRAALGIAAGSEGVFCFAELSGGSNHSLAQWTLCLALVISGAALVFGCFTPVAGLLAGFCFLGMYLKWLPVPVTGLHDPRMLVSGWIVTAVSIVLMGPGAFSLDAYLFGRREIVIPPSVHPPQP